MPFAVPFAVKSLTLLFGEPKVKSFMQQMVRLLGATSQSYRVSYLSEIRCFFASADRLFVEAVRRQPFTMRNLSLMDLLMKEVVVAIRGHSIQQPKEKVLKLLCVEFF